MQSYVSEMSRSSAYGSFIELVAASKFYRFNARVLCDNDDGFRLKFYELNEESLSLPTLHFVLTNSLNNITAHYWACQQTKGVPFDTAALNCPTPEDEALNIERQVYWKNGCMGHNLSSNVALYVHRASDQTFRLKTKMLLAKGNTVTALGGYSCKTVSDTAEHI